MTESRIISSNVGEVEWPKVVRRSLAHFAPGGDVDAIEAAVRARTVPIKAYDALVNEETGGVYNIITPQYQLIKHEQVLETARSAIMMAPEYGGVTEQITLDNEGARMRAEYRFPEVKYTIAGRGRSADVVNPSLHLYNSYDGSWALRGLFGAFRIICSNGLVVGVKMLVYRREHHQPMGGENDLARVIAAAMEKFSDQIQLWKGWVDRVTTAQEYEGVMATLGWNKTEEEEIGGEVEVASGIKLEAVKTKTLTLWAFYNILAQYLTHKVKSEARRVRLQGQMAKAFSGRWAQ